MNKYMVLGAGAIGIEVFDYLRQQDKNVVLASRQKRDYDDYVQVNAIDSDDLLLKTKDITHLFVCIGLPYNRQTWESQWPIILDNVIASAKVNQFKIIFFDNVYMYGHLNNPVTESHPMNPCSDKGRTREKMANQLLTAMSDIDCLIARAPDFFGPGATNSVLYNAFLENILKNKKPMFIGSLNKKHSYAYTKDIAKALVMLAEEEDTYQQIWYLPTFQTNSISDILDMINQQLNTSFKVKPMSKFINGALAGFVPILREVKEMRYQFDEDYVLDFSKFTKRFPDFKLSKFEDDIAETIKSFQ